MWCKQWSFQKTVRVPNPYALPRRYPRKSPYKGKIPMIMWRDSQPPWELENNLPYNEHCFCRDASSPAEGLQGNRLRDPVQSGLLRHPTYGSVCHRELCNPYWLKRTPGHILHTNLNAEDVMEKVALRPDGVHRVLSLDAYVSRGHEGKGKGESTCQDYLITHGIKSWLLSQSPPPRRSEKGKLSQGNGDLETWRSPGAPFFLTTPEWLLFYCLTEKYLLFKKKRKRKISSKFPIDLSSNITIF